MDRILADNGALPPFGAVFAMAAPSEAAIQALRDKLVAYQEENEKVVADADEAERDLSDDELSKIDANQAEIEKLTKQISAREAVKVEAGPGPKSRREPAVIENGKPSRGVPASPRDSQRHGFNSLGEFCVGARMHAQGNREHQLVQKIAAAATTYSNETTGTDGGFLVPPEFASQIWQKVEAEENLMARCTELTLAGNTITIPKDETTPWGTTGVQAYWEPEAAAATQSKAVLEASTLRLYKLMALAPVTDELLEDSVGFESWLRAKVPGIIAHKINDAIVAGTGAGMPLGILNSASKVSVAKETSQPADTVWFSNINKMWSRMYAPWRRNSVWLINQDIEPSLHGMAFQATGASSMLPGTSAVPAYLPMNGLSSSPYATLMGRPVVPVQACKTVGDQGDIILVDLRQYWIIRKAAGLRADTSIHVFFDQATTAFRFIFRVNGQPAYSSAISPANGSNTLSWAVLLDAR